MENENQVQAEEQQVEIPNIYGMSDEEIGNLDLNFLEQGSIEGSQEGALDDAQADEAEEVTADDEGEVEASSPEDDAGEAEEDDQGGDADTDAFSEEDEDTSSQNESDPDEADSAQEDDKKSDGEVDYKAAYEQIFTPFKANGKEIQAKDVEDVVALMQMGANYNKKMAALKPNLKTLKLLEKNDLLDESKLSYAIDLMQKKPEAIKQLIKDSGIDPLDIDSNEESEYKPEVRTVDDREIELDSVLDDIKDTPTYRETINIVSSKWDGSSKQTVAQNPQLLKIINDHVASGVYEVISNEIESERMFGRLNGVSDLDAYRQVGDAIQARGGFDHLFKKSNESVPASQKQPTAPKKAPDPKLKSKKRAASSTRKAVSNSQSEDFNPLSLSDNEFEKLVNERLM